MTITARCHTPVHPHSLIRTPLLSLQTCHLRCRLASLLSGCWPGERKGETPPTPLSPFWRDVEKASKCGLNDVHFNDLFAFVQKCWPSAVLTFEILQKQTPAALIPSITYFLYIIREIFVIKINRMKKIFLEMIPQTSNVMQCSGHMPQGGT